MSAVSPPLRTVTLTQSDVKRLPRLCGSVEVGNGGDVDVLSVLQQQYRVVAGFRVQTVRPGDESYADSVAFEFFSLILDGPAATMYQQLMSGCINWQATVVDTASYSQNAGSFTPPSNWKELSNAVLDLMMPSNSVEECALRLASF
ncbi:unnamed protein product, partial [Pylaiella littoralis]